MKRSGELTQKERIVKRLLATGQISRNECLRNFISRLGAIICDLEAEGWEFDAKYNENRDYIYRIIKTPYTKVQYKLPNGEIITRIEK